MKNRYFTFLLLAACFLMIFPPVAQADVLIEPSNDFYYRNRNACTYLGRSFYANGENGFVTVKEAPDSKREVAVLENGESVLIQFTYKNSGQTWGAALLNRDRNEPDGWLPMEQLLPVYDYISFEEGHQAEIYPYNGDYEELPASGNIVFWTWPGSGEIAWILEAEWRNPDSEAHWMQPTQGYTDGEGREWGFFSYVYGTRNLWACTSDPLNRDIPAFNPPPQPELWSSSATGTTPGGLSVPLLIIILVAALAVSTVVLIRVFWNPHNRDNRA